MKFIQAGLTLLIVALLMSPGEVLAQRRGGRGGSFHGSYHAARPGGFRYATPHRSFYRSAPLARSYYRSVPMRSYAARSLAGRTYRSALPFRATAPYRTNAYGRFAAANRGRAFVSRMNRFNRPWYGYHRGWYRGAWNNWWYYPSFWAGLYGGSWLNPWVWGGSYTYYNPYWLTTDVVGVDTYVPDYATPIPVPTDNQVSSVADETVNDAMTHFSAARDLFKRGLYAQATTEVDRAIQLAPGDRTMHEFRALTLFARSMYTDAAATVYAVLSAGPGWNWETMAGLYLDTAVYTRQLRALEQFVRDHPRDGAARFLLGYHYLVLDDRVAAIIELRAAAKLTPKDKLSALIADALEKTPPPEQ